MREGLYSAHFRIGTGDEGNGVAFIKDGQVWGGDSVAYFVGTYSENNHAVEAHLTANRHAAGQMLFPVDRFEVATKGSVTGDTVTLAGSAVFGSMSSAVTIKLKFLKPSS
jgi:hypothetical protein